MQLRIFEVPPEETGATSASRPETAPEATVPAPAALAEAETQGPVESATGESEVAMPVPDWRPIRLDAQPNSASQEGPAPSVPMFVPQSPASIDQRLMALSVDFCLVTGGFLAFLLVFALSTPHLPTGKLAWTASVVVYGALWLLYQALFFTLSDATAGMRYARIALCTFADTPPTRKQMLWRILAWWVSVLPLGTGIAWAFFDEDGLCWHDRLLHIYMRKY
jgi:hypothetical protein